MWVDFKKLTEFRLKVVSHLTVVLPPYFDLHFLPHFGGQAFRSALRLILLCEALTH
jgi:hypothetical protein